MWGQGRSHGLAGHSGHWQRWSRSTFLWHAQPSRLVQLDVPRFGVSRPQTLPLVRTAANTHVYRGPDRPAAVSVQEGEFSVLPQTPQTLISVLHQWKCRGQPVLLSSITGQRLLLPIPARRHVLPKGRRFRLCFLLLAPRTRHLCKENLLKVSRSEINGYFVIWCRVFFFLLSTLGWKHRGKREESAALQKTIRQLGVKGEFNLTKHKY